MIHVYLFTTTFADDCSTDTNDTRDMAFFQALMLLESDSGLTNL